MGWSALSRLNAWRICWRIALAALWLAHPQSLAAQNILSVPFTNGFIGVTGSNPQDATNVTTFASLGIARIFFIQNSSTSQYQALQGNDIAGTVRLVGSNGGTLDVPASAVWRQNPGGTTVLIGFIPRPTAPLTWQWPGGSLQITDGSVSGGSNIGGYLAGFAGPYATNGTNQNGNAATNSVLASLNAYLATVVSSRPPGPVTVTTEALAEPEHRESDVARVRAATAPRRDVQAVDESAVHREGA